MGDQNEFDFRLQLLRDEISEIHQKIGKYDDLSIKIKIWTITLWTVVLGYSINQKSPWISAAMIPAVIAFWFLDAHYKSYQQRSMTRMGYIEKFINRSIGGSIRNLSDAYKKQTFGSFIIPDPIGRQTCKVNERFNAYYQKKISFRRSLWVSNVRVLYLFLSFASLLSSVVIFLAY